MCVCERERENLYHAYSEREKKISISPITKWECVCVNERDLFLLATEVTIEIVDKLIFGEFYPLGQCVYTAAYCHYVKP